jgi:hypothetical protein
MKKIAILLLFLLSSLFLFPEAKKNQLILIDEFRINYKAGIKKINLEDKLLMDVYQKLIIESTDNQINFGAIRLFFLNGSEQNIKGGQGTLTVNPGKRLEIAVTNKNKLEKLTLYYSNQRDKEKATVLKVYLVK